MNYPLGVWSGKGQPSTSLAQSLLNGPDALALTADDQPQEVRPAVVTDGVEVLAPGPDTAVIEVSDEAFGN